MMARHADLESLGVADNSPSEYERLTDDELNVQLLRILLAIERRHQTFSFYVPVCALHENQARIDAIVGDIISTADAQARPDYQSHLEWCRERWAKRGTRTLYVPAVTGGGCCGGFGEIQDWDAPNVMQRREKLRGSPLVQEILSTHRLH